MVIRRWNQYEYCGFGFISPPNICFMLILTHQLTCSALTLGATPIDHCALEMISADKHRP